MPWRLEAEIIANVTYSAPLKQGKCKPRSIETVRVIASDGPRVGRNDPCPVEAAKIQNTATENFCLKAHHAR